MCFSRWFVFLANCCNIVVVSIAIDQRCGISCQHSGVCVHLQQRRAAESGGGRPRAAARRRRRLPPSASSRVDPATRLPVAGPGTHDVTHLSTYSVMIRLLLMQIFTHLALKLVVMNVDACFRCADAGGADRRQRVPEPDAPGRHEHAAVTRRPQLRRLHRLQTVAGAPFLYAYQCFEIAKCVPKLTDVTACS